MKQVLSEEQFAAFIGIDWADAKHDLFVTSTTVPMATGWNDN